jgi:1,3-beta-galactosyl-N-acetylhexosamine phosphorylase
MLTKVFGIPCVGFLLTVVVLRAEVYEQRDARHLPDASVAVASMLPESAAHAFPADEPIMTLLHYRNEQSPNYVPDDRALPFLKKAGVNHVWGWPPERPPEAFFRSIHLVNMTHKKNKARNEQEWFYAFLRTDWVRRGSDPVVFNLLDRYYPKRFLIPREADKALAFRIEEKETGKYLDAEDFEVDRAAGTVRLTGGVPGRSYRVIFLAGDRGVAWHFKLNLDDPKVCIADGTIPSVKKRQFAVLDTMLEGYPDVAVIRPTSEVYDRLGKLGNPDDGESGALRHMDRQAYWQGFHPERLARFEALYGHPFDPRWVIDSGFGETGWLPTPGMLEWIDLVRNDLGVYVRERNNLIHRHGKRVRLFFGDAFVGIEPYLGDVCHNGYDEIVQPMDLGPGSVRFITGFPGETRRILRFQWSATNFSGAEYRNLYQAAWRWMKREILFQCPDGLTLGGVGTKAIEIPEIKSETLRIFDDFRTIFDRTHDKEVFKHEGFHVYVLSAWGRMRSWKGHSHYLSQVALPRSLVDLPVHVKWLSFNEVINHGVPKDASVVILNGEPDTAWGGGELWKNETLVARITEFVRSGGGLIAIGAPTLVDGRFALGDVFGVEYAGAPNPECADNLWSPTRWAENDRKPEDYPMGGVMPVAGVHANPYQMSADLEGRFDGQGRAWNLRFPALVRAKGATVLAHENFSDVGDGAEAWRFLHFRDTSIEKSRTGVFANDFGRGRCVWIGGWSNDPEYLSLLEPLLFHAANRTSDLDRLNTGDEQVAVYFYPEPRMLIAYNHSARRKTTDLRFDPSLAGLQDSQEVVLTPLDEGQPTLKMASGESRNGFPVTLDPGKAVYWKVGDASP